MDERVSRIISAEERKPTAAAGMLSSSNDGTVRLWSVADVPLGEQTVLGMSEGAAVQPLATLEGHSGPVWGVALSEDGRLLASSGPDGTVRLWSLADVRPGEETRLGTRASGVPPSAGLVQRLPGGRLLATLQGHTGGVRGVALSADGRLLASGSQDGTLRLWEASTGAHLNTLRSDRRYERVDITGLTGVTAAQRASLLALGAVDHRGQPTRA